MIDGVMIKEPITHTDERGSFREIVRKTDEFFGEGFGQWSHSMSYIGVARAWHVHQLQTEWLYVAVGVCQAALYDTRPDSPTSGELMEVLMGELYGSKVLKVPPGVAHGYKVLEGPAHIFYLSSRVYDPADEGRIPHDDPSIGYDWRAGPHIK